METNPMIDWMRHYASQGLSLHWLPMVDGKPTKAIYDNGWQTRPKIGAETLSETYQQGANLGVRPGKFSSPYPGYALVIIDFDVNNAACSPEDLAEAKAALWALFGCDPSYYPSVISGSGGSARHYWAVVPDHRIPPSQKAATATKKALKLGKKTPTPVWQIEFMANHRQVVVPPSVHPDTGGYYRWEKDLTGGIPQLSEDAIERLMPAAPTHAPQEVAAGMPVLLPEADLPEIEDLFVPDQAKQFLRGEIGPYTPGGTASETLMAIASQMFLGGHAPAEVLSTLYYHCHEVAVRHSNEGRAAQWLWKYTVSPAAKKFERRIDPPPLKAAPDPADDEDEETAGDPGGDSLPVRAETNINDLVRRAMTMNIDDDDDAVRLYAHAVRMFSATKAERVMVALQGRGFKPNTIKTDAKRLMMPSVKPGSAVAGPGEVLYGDHTDPLHPVNQRVRLRFEPTIEYLLGRFIYLPPEGGGNGRWYDRATRTFYGTRALDAACKATIQRMIADGTAPPKVTASTLLLSRDDLIYAFGETYWPGIRSTVVDTLIQGRGSVPLINRWVPDNTPIASADCGPWLDHLRRLVPEPREQNHLLDLLACVLQKPEVKINHALVFVSSLEGTGKDTLFKPLHLALKSDIAEVNYRMVLSDHQSWMKDKKIIIIQEQASDSRMDLQEFDNAMKDKIASTGSGVSMMNLKYGKQDHTQPNLMFFVIMSNHGIPVMPGNNSRRYFAVKVPEDYTPDSDALDALHKWIDEGGWINVINYLKTRNITRFRHADPPPKTAYFETLSGMSSNGAVDAVRDAAANMRRKGKLWFTAKDLHYALLRDDSVDMKFYNTVDKVDRLALQAHFSLLLDGDGKPFHLPVPEAFWNPMLAESGVKNSTFLEMKRRRVFASNRRHPPTGVSELDILESLCPENLRNAFVEWYKSGKYHKAVSA